MEKNIVTFTNEKLAKKFKSNFELVNFAIHLAEEKIRAGRDSHAVDNDNLVITIMRELAAGKDMRTPVVAITPVIEAVEIDKPKENVEAAPVDGKRKAKRKIIKDED